jgi:hypothetical protein
MRCVIVTTAAALLAIQAWLNGAGLLAMLRQQFEAGSQFIAGVRL